MRPLWDPAYAELVAKTIERALELAKEQYPGLDVMSIGQSHPVELIDPDLLETLVRSRPHRSVP